MPLGKWIVILSTNDIKPKSFIVDLKCESLFQIDLLAKQAILTAIHFSLAGNRL